MHLEDIICVIFIDGISKRTEIHNLCVIFLNDTNKLHFNSATLTLNFFEPDFLDL